jgi:hypothetical protein
MVLNGYGREMKAKAILMNPSYGGIIMPEKNFFQACVRAFKKSSLTDQIS